MNKYNLTPLQQLITINSEAKDALFTAWHLLKDTKHFGGPILTETTRQNIDAALLFFDKLFARKIECL